MFIVIDKRGHEITIYAVNSPSAGLVQGLTFEDGKWKWVYLDKYVPKNEYERNSHIRMMDEYSDITLDPTRFYDRGYINPDD